MDNPKPSTSQSAANHQLDDENANIVKVAPNDERLTYLMKQAELFAHFVHDSPPTTGKTPKKEKKKIMRKTKSNEIQDDELSPEKKPSNIIRFEQTPSYINGKMRDYQLRGLNWLISLHENKINGILADEMGLGKTLQTISMLGYLKFHKGLSGPFLVIGPKSTLQNWNNEIAKFCPKLKCTKLIGDKLERDKILREMIDEDNEEWDVCCTTFDMILLEKGRLSRFDWEFIVIDEAHRLKNEKSRFSKIMRTFSSRSRLLLTGTPLQNNLHELWSLLNYLLPDIFASSDDFDSWFDSDDCLRGNEDIVKRLHTILKPFMLRRVKADVEKSLLPKIEMKLYVGLTELQRQTYVKVLRKEMTRINAFGEETAKRLDNVVMELRKVTNHPYLIQGIEPEPFRTDENLINCCGKMMLLDKLLVKLKAQGSRVLIFSQFVIMLDILDDYLNFRGYNYRRLDGNTPYEDRAKAIDEFNAENSDVFIYLISTRAGGLGINLATADTVIIYDSDWNPQMDLQAIDRAHRIGQKKQVRVFRLVTENTVDERIVQRAEIKLRLDRMIIQQGRNGDNKITAKETAGMKRDIIRFGLDKLQSDASSITDIDIDAIMEHGAKKTADENAKLAELGESQLRNMTLEEASSTSVYEFEGNDYRAERNARKDDKWDLRDKRKIQYNMTEQPRPATPTPKAPKEIRIRLHPFQFFPKQLLDLCDQPNSLNMSNNTEMKQALLDQGFPNWTRNDYRIFFSGIEMYGRNDVENIAKLLPEKSIDDVIAYHKVFIERGPEEIRSIRQIFAKMDAEDQKKSKLENRMRALQCKMEKYREPLMEMEFPRRKDDIKWTIEIDRYLIFTYYSFGMTDPMVMSRIHADILVNKRVRFNWFIRSRTTYEIEQRIEYLTSLILKEQTIIGGTKETRSTQQTPSKQH